MDCDAFRDEMLDVLYGEAARRPRGASRRTRRACADCREELADLRRLRGDLSQWRLPERLGTSPARSARPRRLPLGLAAAAALILRRHRGLLSPAPSCATTRPASPCVSGRGAESRAARRPRDARHREELAALRAELAAAASVATTGSSCARVAEMIHESEARQDESRLASLRVLRQRAETQRQYDLARMSAGLSYLDGKAGLQAARTTELVGHVLQASQQK